MEIASGDLQVVARVVQLLRLLAANETIDLVSAAEELGVGKSTAHRYLASMENHGLLQRRDRNRYEFGVLLAELGTMALSRLGVLALARPVMEQISVSIRHTVVLSVWNGTCAVVAQVREDSSRTAHVSITVGSQLGPNAAQSVVFWAFRDQSFYRFREGAPPVNATEAELAEVRRTGIAFRKSPREGVSAVATAVRNPAGQVVATLAVVDIAQFVPEEIDSPVARALLAGAETISRRMVSPLDGGVD
ncbi:helix-turn-helix domain-containing protein [Phytohabitans sp. ZYX-F-186]|uniref:Helix-turn-helix domain-containing protein n=1 Tax=Phytohabitans maris TaxID=3071409 RepID=A0ABU0ZVB8_9ACTN|nr:helix-turn-helix domain-containing protein [Phytohabitans sp. ZYX-F-186]MDQ7910442.1 helix-turn-helix domain-containing protein [Phytohabitans sp. ZYX-F-186]